MPLVKSQQLLLDAQAKGYAVGAFNIENMEMAQAVLSAACALRAPVMIQTTPGTVRYAGLRVYAAMVAALAEECPVPVALHLDHGDSFALAVQAVNAGYTSVMIDGSHEAFADNIDLTARVVACASPCGIPVEAELGTVGGKEDDLDGGAGGYTDPAQAAEFVRRTGAASLAVAIGTAHGVYASEPRLDVERLRQIRGEVEVPLVLHGASGLSDDQVRECIGAGICKVNFATELRCAYTDGVREELAAKPEAYDPKTYGAKGKERVKQLVMNRMRVCGCVERC